tara:strand:- start:222 stop:1211 length:990 start_codon:yes stop_codon:yes gene_type:complete
MRSIVSIGLILDRVFFPKLRKPKIIKPIIIVGNPRSGTTFLQRYLIKSGLGIGSELWQIIYPSRLLQKMIRPLLPLLEKISPARHHSTAAHKTSLSSVETDDVGLFFKYFDGFFLYGFILAFDNKDLFDFFDPKIRNTNKRDFNWFEIVWSRIVFGKNKPYLGKLFSLSTSLPAFQKRFPDAKILYMIREPLNVIPSGLSLVTGVLDKRFGFWNLDKEIRDQYLLRLYNALVELLKRFHYDWVNNNIDKSKVLIVKYDKMMSNFDDLMNDILKFVDVEPSDELIKEIKKTTLDQKNYISKHKYDLKKFNLTEEKIKADCHFVYETFLVK